MLLESILVSFLALTALALLDLGFNTGTYYPTTLSDVCLG